MEEDLPKGQVERRGVGTYGPPSLPGRGRGDSWGKEKGDFLMPEKVKSSERGAKKQDSALKGGKSSTPEKNCPSVSFKTSFQGKGEIEIVQPENSNPDRG